MSSQMGNQEKKTENKQKETESLSHICKQPPTNQVRVYIHVCHGLTFDLLDK